LAIFFRRIWRRRLALRWTGAGCSVHSGISWRQAWRRLAYSFLRRITCSCRSQTLWYDGWALCARADGMGGCHQSRCGVEKRSGAAPLLAARPTAMRTRMRTRLARVLPFGNA
jgi:hypothetical protein